LSLTIQDAMGLSVEELRSHPKEELEALARELLQTRDILQQENQIVFYQPANDDARKIHLSTARQIFTLGGNRSSKTETHLVELVIQMTGIVPDCLKDDYPQEKIRPPIRARLICTSLDNVWGTVIKPKLQWNVWSGREPVGGQMGHWGWIPKELLMGGKWENSWREKDRTLTLTNGSSLQVMAYTQDLEEFRGASLHLVLCDEGPPEDIYRENLMRLIDVGGRIMTAMTPPDDTNTAWDAAWVAEVFERGLDGPAKDPLIDSFQLLSEKNRTLPKTELYELTKDLTPLQRQVRLEGRFIHLSGLIYPDYTNRPQMWCFTCNQTQLVVNRKCAGCSSSDVVEFCHVVEPVELAFTWPVVFLMDPHPRKAHMVIWVAVDRSDDYWEIAEDSINDTPENVAKRVFDFEKANKLTIVKRIGDPRMLGQQAHVAGRREVTVRDEFDAVGLRMSLAGGTFNPGHNRLTERLRPDRFSRQPRIHIFNTCKQTDYQMKRYVWDEWTHDTPKRDQKQEPIRKNDDFPTLLRYLCAEEPRYVNLQMGQNYKPSGKRRSAYG